MLLVQILTWIGSLAAVMCVLCVARFTYLDHLSIICLSDALLGQPAYQVTYVFLAIVLFMPEVLSSFF